MIFGMLSLATYAQAEITFDESTIDYGTISKGLMDFGSLHLPTQEINHWLSVTFALLVDVLYQKGLQNLSLQEKLVK